MHEDMLCRPIQPGNYVVYYSNIYEVIELLGNNGSGTKSSGLARIRLVDSSKTTKSVKKYCYDMCVIDTNDVLMWKLKRGY